ncbi:MAG TPA: Wzz/FepE/Etk N-terminal domain-containing protein [Chloroflexota bacterium]|nr:Wzz/FepE/Etk N-terminal domain-containing protein [Chloroflexota bacterium]
MDFTPGWDLARRWWPLGAFVTLLAGLLAYAASFLISPTYSSTTRVLVRAYDARLLSSTGEDVAARPGTIDVTQPKSLNQTLAGLATSRAVAEQVVNDLKLDGPPAEDGSFFGRIKATVKGWVRVGGAMLQYGYYAEPTPHEAAVDRIRRSIDATPIKDSYLIEIKARADDPGLAKAIAESATRAFIQQSGDEFQRHASKFQSVLAGEVDRARAEVDRAESALEQYKSEHGISDIAEAQKLSAADEQTLRQQLRDVEVNLGSQRARQEALRSTIATLSPTERTTSQASGQNSVSTSTTAEAGRAATTTSNDSATNLTENRETVSPSRVYQDLQKDSLSLAAEIAALEAKRDRLDAALQTRTQAAAQLAADAARIDALDLQRSSAHSAYSSIRASYEAAVVNDARGAQEVAQVDAATQPVYPDKPLRYLFVLFGLMFGLAGGAGLAFGLDRWQRGVEMRPVFNPQPSGLAAASTVEAGAAPPPSTSRPGVATPATFEI